MIANNHLYYQNDRRVPMTSISIVFPGGGVQQEEDGMVGLAKTTAKMLLRGTINMDRQAITQQLELLGAEINASVTEADFVISLSAFTHNLDAVLGIVRNICKDSIFPQHELDLVKKQELNKITAALQDPEQVLSFGSLFISFNGKSFGKIGSISALERITRDDVIRFYAKVWSAASVYFTAISDLSHDTIEQRIRRLVDGRQTDGFVLQQDEEFGIPSGRQATIFRSLKATNDRLLWSHRGITAADDRRIDLGLILDALGSFEGHLFDVLRNKNGWCYGVYAYTSGATLRPGRMLYYADPSDSTSYKLIPELLKQLEHFADDADFRIRLSQRNETFKNRYAYQLDLKYKLTSEIYRDRYGVPIYDRPSYHQRIDRVTMATAQQTIKEVFDVQNMQMVFHGDPDRIAAILNRIDPSIPISVLDKEVLIA